MQAICWGVGQQKDQSVQRWLSLTKSTKVLIRSSALSWFVEGGLFSQQTHHCLVNQENEILHLIILIITLLEAECFIVINDPLNCLYMIIWWTPPSCGGQDNGCESSFDHSLHVSPSLLFPMASVAHCDDLSVIGWRLWVEHPHIKIYIFPIINSPWSLECWH